MGLTSWAEMAAAGGSLAIYLQRATRAVAEVAPPGGGKHPLVDKPTRAAL